MFIHYKPQRNKKLAPKKVVEELKIEEVIPTFEEEIPVVEDYNEETLLSELNKFLEEDTCEEEESMGEDY
jgi:hypothetical protein